MTKIGVQAMMLRKYFASDGPFETLRAVREIGYNAVEISQLSMTRDNIAELQRARAELGMDIAALSAPLKTPSASAGESLTTAFEKIVGDAESLDAKLIRIPILPLDAMRSLGEVREFCDASDEMARRLADHGIELCY